jgi:hypothetical protein
MGKIGDSPGQMFRPKGVAVDSEDHLYIVDGLSGWCRFSIARAGCCIFWKKRT